MNNINELKKPNKFIDLYFDVQKTSKNSSTLCDLMPNERTFRACITDYKKERCILLDQIELCFNSNINCNLNEIEKTVTNFIDKHN